MLRAGDGCGSARGEPCFDFAQIPYDASWREREASRKLAALLHLIDGAVGERHHLAQLLSTDRPLDRCLAFRRHRSPPWLQPRPIESDRRQKMEDLARARRGAEGAGTKFGGSCQAVRIAGRRILASPSFPEHPWAAILRSRQELRPRGLGRHIRVFPGRGSNLVKSGACVRMRRGHRLPSASEPIGRRSRWRTKRITFRWRPDQSNRETAVTACIVYSKLLSMALPPAATPKVSVPFSPRPALRSI